MTGKGGAGRPFPENKDVKPAEIHSQNQADGTAADRPKGETDGLETQAHAAQSNKGLADDTSSGKVKSSTPENRTGKIDPSSPTNSTEGGTTSMPQNPTMDSAGEIGEPSGKGTINIKENTMNKDQGNNDKGNVKDFDKDNKQGQPSTQQNKQGGQQAQGQNQGADNQKNMSGRSDRQEDSQATGNQASQQSGQKQGDSDKQASQQSGQDQKKAGKSSENMDEENNQGDRKTA